MNVLVASQLQICPIICVMVLQKQNRIGNIESLYDDASYEAGGKLRIVCTSDTHNQTDRCNFTVPDGDVLLHAGDFSQVSTFFFSRSIYYLHVIFFVYKHNAYL